MIICPRCSYPQKGTFGIIAEREVACQRCEWKGVASDLIAVPDGKYGDARVFDELYGFLQEDISKRVGEKLVGLGLIKKINEIPPHAVEAHVHKLTNILINYSRVGFESLLRGILENDGEAS
jgi:hypothetical protein